MKNNSGGDAYTAPMAKINDEVHYLHRDYLGSILAISNSSGTVVEERQFGAWGEVDFFKKNGQEADFSESILPRGFTGHEHFSEIALIHMNGRMYDPQLRRFLSPDNNIIDPFDTRSFDRFAYVQNNPLMLVDPEGEFLVETLLVITTLVGFVLGNISGNASNNADPETGRWNWRFWEWTTFAIGTPNTWGQNPFNPPPGSLPDNSQSRYSLSDVQNDPMTSSNSGNDTPCPFPILLENCNSLGYSNERPTPPSPSNTPATTTDGGNEETNENENDSEEEDFRIFNELTGKALCVYERLERISGGFRNAIKKFDGEFPVAHLKYKNSSTLSSTVNAQTSPPSNFLITIQINENNLNRPNLSIARTIIHETIHAEMFRMILSILDNGRDLDGLTRAEWLNKL